MLPDEYIAELKAVASQSNGNLRQARSRRQQFQGAVGVQNRMLPLGTLKARIPGDGLLRKNLL